MASLRNAQPVVLICTRDRAVSMPFYRDVLGLELLGEDAFAAVFALHGRATLRLSTVEGWKAHEHAVFGFAVDDVSSAARELARGGVALNRYPGFNQDADGVWTSPDASVRVAWFSDPDGNVLSLAQFVR